MGGLAIQRIKEEVKDVNELEVGGVSLGEVFPGIVEKIKLKPGNFTGEKGNVKAFFNTFRGRPQVSFKYGLKYYVFDLVVGSVLDCEYARGHNFK